MNTQTTTEVQELFVKYHDRLRKMVAVRLHPLLRRRIDPSDVVMEAFTEATRRYPDRDQSMLPFMWIRFLTMQKLVEIHRRHIDVKQRSIKREAPRLSRGASVRSLARSSTSAGGKLRRKESAARVHAAIRQLSPDGQEIVLLRNFEQLSCADAAAVIGISEAAASKRYVRALTRLKSLLDDDSSNV